MGEEKKVEPNWQTIEIEYRADTKSIRAQAREHGVSEGTIRKRAKNEKWTRDLSKRIRAKADEMVRKESVRSDTKNGENPASCVPKVNGGINKSAAKKKITASKEEEIIVEANAAVQSAIILAHRKDIQRARTLSMNLLSELEGQTDGQDLIAEMRAFLLSTGEGIDKAQAQLLRKLTSLGARSSTMKTLADSLRGLVMLEREAFGIKAEGDGDKESGVEDVIKRVMAKNEGLG